MASSFDVIEHIITGQHVREAPSSVRPDQNGELQLAVKQYIPHANKNGPIPVDAVTILGLPAIGFPKEAYEPLWDDLYKSLLERGVHLRSIWMAEPTSQGASYVLNESVQGHDANWFDHSRDLLLMANQFRHSMPQPIIGLAHSRGCAQLVRLSIMHPSLLAGVLLYEPIMMNERKGTQPGPHPSLLSTIRRDLWPTQAAAEASLSKGFRTFDPRVLALYLKYGLRTVPTALYKPGDPLPASRPSKDGARSDNEIVTATAVTLTTPKAQEAWAYARPNFDPADAHLDRILRPDWDRSIELPRLSSCPECMWAFRELPHLRPRTLFVFGAQSPFSDELDQAEKMQLTGTSWGGSGGEEADMVKKVVLRESGHLPVFEQVGESARVGAEWIAATLREWKEDQKVRREHDPRKSVDGMLKMSEEWMKMVKMDSNAARPRREKL